MVCTINYSSTYSINSNNYGNPKRTPLSFSFSKNDVFKVAQRIIVEVIEYYLPKRTVQTETDIDKIFDESYDKVGKVLQRRESDVVINAKPATVNVTKKTNDTPDKPYIKDYELAEEIKKEVPKDIAIPKFSKPSPKKSTKISVVQSRVPTSPTNTSIYYGGGGGGSDS